MRWDQKSFAPSIYRPLHLTAVRTSGPCPNSSHHPSSSLVLFSHWQSQTNSFHRVQCFHDVHLHRSLALNAEAAWSALETFPMMHIPCPILRDQGLGWPGSSVFRLSPSSLSSDPLSILPRRQSFASRGNFHYLGRDVRPRSSPFPVRAITHPVQPASWLHQSPNCVCHIGEWFKLQGIGITESRNMPEKH